jgi:hypothetical protein
MDREKGKYIMLVIDMTFMELLAMPRFKWCYLQ